LPPAGTKAKGQTMQPAWSGLFLYPCCLGAT
jgi:hypothetical protein